ncbi:MAG: hypothetical protein HKP36_11785 [Myxococcales bacterium]|nr:hypothetical protein [Deltaproteobacteria bacterium]NNL25120.1 hypothetical protein [Myxococcales bacterium]
MAVDLVVLPPRTDSNSPLNREGSRLAALFIGLVVLCASAEVLAQCSTGDLDRDGVPDVCPAGSNYIGGSSGDDKLRGTNGVDCLFGFGGDDQIDGRKGDDYICAGSGDDKIKGGNGNDQLYGEGGDDKIDAGKGDDLISGGDGDDKIDGKDGDDILMGGAGDDVLIGDKGADTLSGEDGNDTLEGEGGNDALSGGEGYDMLDGGSGTDSCVEEIPGTSLGLSNCSFVTYAAVNGFEVSREGGSVTVSWETSTEVGTAAFRLWRVETNGGLAWVGELAASPEGSPHGASYSMRDDSAPANGALEYLLEERTVSGGSVQYGPYTRAVRWDSPRDDLPRARSRLGRTPHPVVLRRRLRPAKARAALGFASKRAALDSVAELRVERAGLIEVDASVLASALGLTPSAVAALIRSGELDLRLRGASVAWHAAQNGAAIRFVAPVIDSPFSSHHRYLVSIGKGLTMRTRTLIERTPTEPHRFVETKRFEENVFPGPTGAPDPRQDLFFWHALSSAAKAVIPVSLPALEAQGARELRVVVHGATAHPDQPHRVELHWNGESLGVFDLFGRRRHTMHVSLAEREADVENELIVEQHVAGEAPPALYVDAVEVDYLRRAEADEPLFRFGGADDGAQSVTGLPSKTVHLYDVTTPEEPIYYGEALLGASGDLSFTADGPGLRFLAAAPDSIAAPSLVQAHVPTDLRSTDRNVDYLVISASHLVDDARALADYRTADGYRVLLVDVDDIYWAFSGGVSDPQAIRDFLAFAWQHWQTAPRFATLVGKGSLDYRDLMGVGGNWLPPALANTDGGSFPSDSMFGDVIGDDGVPEIAIGRLPIANGEELGRILAAIEAFERDQASMDALFVADDSGRDEFAAAARVLADWVEPERRRQIDLNTESLEAARDRLFSMWNGQLGWLSYVGHGGLDRLADEGLLTQADIGELVALQSQPFVLSWSCNVVRFDMPGFSSLGEELLTKGTTAGVFGATGWSNHVDADALRRGFTEAAFASDAETVGEAVLAAHRAAAGEPVQLHQVYMLLGDPALRLRVAPSESNPAVDQDDDSPLDEVSDARGPVAERRPGSAYGCEIAPSGGAGGPLGPAALLLGLTLMIRGRRGSRKRCRCLH